MTLASLLMLYATAGMVEIDDIEVIPMRLRDKTDFLIFVMKDPVWPLCEVVLGKEVFKR
jgi:hypothetical protein